MKWVRAIVNTIRPDFGGIATFCEDPDGLLEEPEVREAIRAEKMDIMDWDGTADALESLKEVPNDQKPLVIVPQGPYRHVVQSVLPTNSAWRSISIGTLFGKFSHEVVKCVPRRYWDKILGLHSQQRVPIGVDETAVLLGRAIYGADPLYLEWGDGWLRLLLQVSESPEGLPHPISQTLSNYAPEWLKNADVTDLLTYPASARGALAIIKNTQTDLLSALSESAKDRVDAITSEEKRSTTRRRRLKTLEDRPRIDDSAEAVLELGLLYGEQLSRNTLDEKTMLGINDRFVVWLERNYSLVLSSHNPNVLRLPNLVSRLDDGMRGDRMLLLVVDGLGLPAWNAVEAVWRNDGIISRADTRAAFAILPTVTSLSRRALFEGRPPSQFGPGDHTPKLERTLWQKRFHEDSDYFASSEKMGILDSFSLGRGRICVVDVEWDKRVHSLNPKFDTIADAASQWAGKTELREIIDKALDTQYRVAIVSDHGQVECTGVGRPNSGELTDERSKRVLVFGNATLRDSFASEKYIAFQPAGLSATCSPLFVRGFGSFDQEGVRSFSHGGLSIEEVLVPVAEVHRT